MKRKVKTSEIINLYKIIGAAKYSKMSDDDKIRTWKIVRKLKPIAEQFDADAKDVSERMKPTDNFVERWQRAQEYEQSGKTSDIMNLTEYNEFCKELKDYNQLVGKAIDEMLTNDVEVDFEPLTEEAFSQLMSCNEWTIQQATLIGDFVCDEV